MLGFENYFPTVYHLLYGDLNMYLIYFINRIYEELKKRWVIGLLHENNTRSDFSFPSQTPASIPTITLSLWSQVRFLWHFFVQSPEEPSWGPGSIRHQLGPILNKIFTDQQQNKKIYKVKYIPFKGFKKKFCNILYPGIECSVFLKWWCVWQYLWSFPYILI